MDYEKRIILSKEYVKDLIGKEKYNYYYNRRFIREVGEGIDWSFFIGCLKKIRNTEVEAGFDGNDEEEERLKNNHTSLQLLKMEHLRKVLNPKKGESFKGNPLLSDNKEYEKRINKKRKSVISR